MTASSVAIGLPKTGVDLGIPEDQLQWLLSAYALSSVSSSPTVVFRSHFDFVSPGARRVVCSFHSGDWLICTEGEGSSLLDAFSKVLSLWVAVLPMVSTSSVVMKVELKCASCAIDLVTIAVLRGIQGLGGAATIPACVSLFSKIVLMFNELEPLISPYSSVFSHMRSLQAMHGL